MLVYYLLVSCSLVQCHNVDSGTSYQQLHAENSRSRSQHETNAETIAKQTALVTKQAAIISKQTELIAQYRSSSFELKCQLAEATTAQLGSSLSATTTNKAKCKTAADVNVTEGVVGGLVCHDEVANQCPDDLSKNAYLTISNKGEFKCKSFGTDPGLAGQTTTVSVCNKTQFNETFCEAKHIGIVTKAQVAKINQAGENTIGLALKRIAPCVSEADTGNTQCSNVFKIGRCIDCSSVSNPCNWTGTWAEADGKKSGTDASSRSNCKSDKSDPKEWFKSKVQSSALSLELINVVEYCLPHALESNGTLKADFKCNEVDSALFTDFLKAF